MATMAVSTLGRALATACCRSVVKVAMPQRRGSELPMKARRLDGLIVLLRIFRRDAAA
jgi:hypothetical protein